MGEGGNHEEVNGLVQKLALSRLLEYQKAGNRTLGAVFNDKGEQVNVADQFKLVLSYFEVLPRDLPDFYKYLLDYPDAKPANVENSFHWGKLKFGMKPTLRIVHVLTMHGDKPNQPAYVIAEKQIYSSHYFATALDLTFVLHGSDDPAQPGFYLVKAMGCEQAVLASAFKGSVVRRVAVDRSVSDLQKSLASMKDILEHQR